jgi:hypothetical protein
VNRSNFSSLKGLIKNLPRGAVFGGILVGALLAFEIFNYSTTDFALTDLLGDQLKFAGIRWATILSIAFCGIDFAGIARLFTPEQGRDEPAEVWYLFGAWLLAAAMNAGLTWWGVSLAVMSHRVVGSSLVSQATMSKAIPVFVAVMVWLIRVLIIGTFSMAGERFFGAEKPASSRPRAQTRSDVSRARSPMGTVQTGPRSFQGDQDEDLYDSPSSASQRGDPTYHPLGAAARGTISRGQIRK